MGAVELTAAPALDPPQEQPDSGSARSTSPSSRRQAGRITPAVRSGNAALSHQGLRASLSNCCSRFVSFRPASPPTPSLPPPSDEAVRTNAEPCSPRAMALAAIRSDPADALNDAQRLAVEHGDEPLLVIAGAGVGKTATLAHRLAHLVLAGVDPKRIMLATFSRRAAAELNRRVQRILARRLAPEAAAAATPSYSGTFHSIGARLLREYATRIGLDPAFTIHDREDSADLMALCRHEAGLSQTGGALPDQGDLSGDLFARRQRAESRSPRRSAATFPGRRRTRRRCAACSRPTSRPSSASACSITTTCCSISPRCSASRRSPRRSRRASTICWSTNTRTPTACRPRSC